MPITTWTELATKAALEIHKRKLNKDYVKRLTTEIEAINKQGANSYWLRLYNSQRKFEHNKNGLVLPFLLGLTNIDPIESNLAHIEEFDPEFPDIDVDLLPLSRDHIKKYAEETYGSEHVCNVGLWLTYKAKLALQDAATVLGHNRHETIAMCKELPDEFDEMSYEQAYEEYESFRNFADLKPEVVDLAYKMMGKIKSQGKHAGGLIISAVPVRDFIPLTFIGPDDNKQWTSAWTEGMAASQLSKFGFIKFDLLGLLNISYIYNCKRLIKSNRDIIIDFDDMDPRDDRAGWVIHSDKKEKISLNDILVLDQANKIKLESIFQFDTDFAKSIVKKGGVRSFDDLLIYTSLGRPGPLPMIDVYIKNRDDPSELWKESLHPKMFDILKETKGILTFQEQLLRIWVEVCGFTMPEAEAAQKAVKKKKVEILNEIEPRVVGGAAPLLGTDAAKDLWDKMVSFGRYCFNKCLSANTTMIDPTTNETTTIEKLYQSKQPFKLMSYDGDKFFVDDVVDVHYNGEQEVFDIEFSHGVKQVVTIGHKFMNEFGEMEEVRSLLKSGHAIKYMRDGMTYAQEAEQPTRINDCQPLFRRKNLQPNFVNYRNKIEPRYNCQNHKEIRSEEEIFNESLQYCGSQLLREHKLSGESLLVGSVDRRWLYARGKRICELAASTQRPRIGRTIWKRFKIAEENFDMSQREISSSSSNCEQQEIGGGFEKSWCNSGEIDQRNNPGRSVYFTSFEGPDGWGRVYYGKFKRLSDDKDWVEFCLFSQTADHFSFRMWSSERQNYEVSEQFLCHLLDRLVPNPENSEISLSRCNEIPIEEEANGRCHIVSIKSCGIKKTYSPEMKSNHHNYLTIPKDNQVIHANSHAVAYMIIAYRCLWLKTHFPAEWWAAVLSECPTYRTTQYMGAARSEGLVFGAINVNSLTHGFSVDGDKVTPGVRSIKGIGEAAADVLVSSSEQNKFEGLDDFVNKVGKNKTAIERLIKLGGFDQFHKNRKALLTWYVYNHDSSKEGKDLKKLINSYFIWPNDRLDEERQRQITEYKRLYPKRDKIPKKILEWMPTTPTNEPNGKFDPNKKLGPEEIKISKQLELTFEHILKLFPRNYSLREILQFQKEYLGYYWNSPLEMFVHGTKTTIEDAKTTGILEGVIEEAEVRKGNKGDFMVLNVTDGINNARVNVWGNDILSNDEEVFLEATGVRMRVNWQEKWGSFAVKNGTIIMPLPLKEEDDV